MGVAEIEGEPHKWFFMQEYFYKIPPYSLFRMTRYNKERKIIFYKPDITKKRVVLPSFLKWLFGDKYKVIAYVLTEQTNITIKKTAKDLDLSYEQARVRLKALKEARIIERKQKYPRGFKLRENDIVFHLRHLVYALIPKQTKDKIKKVESFAENAIKYG